MVGGPWVRCVLFSIRSLSLILSLPLFLFSLPAVLAVACDDRYKMLVGPR